ncbi:MAG TPA: enoyl-CoA hydratase/isomerase family protein [Syntrophales bacterium]|nr:enoyl-CoA hydratase/isomerase family protein [Syntrophales bacterium]HQN79231.1 enoyl-CoA hydratase/isomerase family protein [Syntrophales bacterium]HQQ28399.1 enoyl-CoA hydratase/isomerase family protein [Syntrophales bacterium]
MGVDFSVEGHVAKVGLNIGETKNALGPDVLFDLHRIWEECGRDGNVRAVVLYSVLPDMFCSGMDLRTAIPVLTKAREPETEAERWLLSSGGAVGRAMLKCRDLDRPVIAAIHGLCLTGGFEMVMGCELRVASEDAVFQMRETTLGIMPVCGANVFLPMEVGKARAMEILLTGNPFSAATLLEWGFLNRVVPRKKLMDEAMALAERIASNGPMSVRAMVRLSREIRGLSLEEALRREAEVGMPVFASEEAREGVRAQREKRKARF